MFKTPIQKMSLAACLMALVFQGCATSKSDEKLDQRIQKEPEVTSNKQLQAEADQAFGTLPGLNSEQKEKLSKLKTKVRTELDAEREESLKLRAILIQDLTSSSYNDQEVEQVKIRLRKVENSRLSTLFKAVDQVNKILGREHVSRAVAISNIMEMDASRK